MLNYLQFTTFDSKIAIAKFFLLRYYLSIRDCVVKEISIRINYKAYSLGSEQLHEVGLQHGAVAERAQGGQGVAATFSRVRAHRAATTVTAARHFTINV